MSSWAWFIILYVNNYAVFIVMKFIFFIFQFLHFYAREDFD
jgi:hypothetical protein